jgi:peroxiredoxin
MMIAVATPRSLFEQCRDMAASLDERLQQSGAGEAAPRAGDPMPPFILPDEGGRLVSLDGLLRNGPVAITFHRGHWCPYCRISMKVLAQAQREIAPGGGQIVAIMPERQRFAEEFKSKADATFPVLTDMDNGYAMSLNLVFWVGSEMERYIAKRGRDVPSYQGNESWMFPIPATFVVGRDGLIKARFVDPDYRRRMATADLLQALRAAR